jgi:hypothetical protein
MSAVGIEQAERRLTTPRAAAIAGILFAILYITSQLLILLAVPESATDRAAALTENARTISLALSLVPLSGIAFLWFIGVVRDRLGEHEDRFFATVFLGSGLLYLGMVFVAAAMAGGLLASFAADPGLVDDPIYAFSRSVMYQITNIYSLRMASVFVSSLATILLRTGVMPRWFAILTNVLALIMLVNFSYEVLLVFLFPAWVFTFSLLILIANFREKAKVDAGVADIG